MTEQAAPDFTPTPDNPLYGVGTVAAMFDVSQHQVRDWIRSDFIKATKVNGQWKILRSEVARVANEEYGSGE